MKCCHQREAITASPAEHCLTGRGLVIENRRRQTKIPFHGSLLTQFRVAQGSHHAEYTAEDPDDEGLSDGTGVLQYSLGTHEDAGSHDYAHDDGHAVQQADLFLQLHPGTLAPAVRSGIIGFRRRNLEHLAGYQGVAGLYSRHFLECMRFFLWLWFGFRTL